MSVVMWKKVKIKTRVEIFIFPITGIDRLFDRIPRICIFERRGIKFLYVNQIPYVYTSIA